MSDNSKSWRRSQQEAIMEQWREFAKDSEPNEIIDTAARVMTLLRPEVSRAAGLTKQDVTLRHFELLNAMALEFDAPLASLMKSLGNNDDGRYSRLLLKAMLELSLKAILPQGRSENLLVLVPLPGWYAEAVLSDLKALDVGDHDTIFRPPKSGKHISPYDWMNARHEAVHHVAFLCGQGHGKVKSREMVGKAMGVGVATLRDWEREVSKETIHRAKTAGQIYKDNVDKGIPYPKPIDANILAVIEGLDNHLQPFAEYYREKFGSRHNQIPPS